MADRLPHDILIQRSSIGRFAVSWSLTAVGLNSSSTLWLSIGCHGSSVVAPGAGAGHDSQRAGHVPRGAGA